ncbi:MAG: NAD(P)H-dependent oxidoreductase [Clostridiales bacterium]|nr:NAD(P)H-dependent oxidoreductase [Clostridiales bacterium]
MSKKVGILVGSLRKDSFTKFIAKEAAKLFPGGIDIEFVEIGHLPFYNQDFEDPATAPESHTAFRQQIEGLDGFIFATPEYNRSYTPALKNALDIASRPYGFSKWNGKPYAVLSVSPGAIGGFGANHHLRQVLMFLNMNPVQQPEAYIGNVTELIDDKGKLNSKTVTFLQTVVDALVAKL